MFGVRVHARIHTPQHDVTIRATKIMCRYIPRTLHAIKTRIKKTAYTCIEVYVKKYAKHIQGILCNVLRACRQATEA
jgi:hypothetical protein